MSLYELKLPKMGESVAEARVIQWLVKEGQAIEKDDIILEVATDKVDSDVPCPVEGILEKILIQRDEVAQVGQALAIIKVVSDISNNPTDLSTAAPPAKVETKASSVTKSKAVSSQPEQVEDTSIEQSKSEPTLEKMDSGVLMSPLVRNICRKEGIPNDEIANVQGSGLHGRITKEDILAYIERKKGTPTSTHVGEETEKVGKVVTDSSDRIVELSRMQKLVSEHMVNSKRVSPHVTSFVETDVTDTVDWREKIKDDFLARNGVKITFTSVLLAAVAKALRKYPEINSSLSGEQWIIKKNVNIGIATALSDGNLIVPVIKNADRLNLLGIAHAVHDIISRARKGTLNSDDISGGTFTITNVGTFGNLTGTPIINQPQAAILAAGMIQKKPAVIETPQGDTLGIRKMMMLAMSYDHRIINGYLGGSFLKEVGDLLAEFYSEGF